MPSPYAHGGGQPARKIVYLENSYRITDDVWLANFDTDFAKDVLDPCQQRGKDFDPTIALVRGRDTIVALGDAFALDPTDTAPHDRPASSNESQRNLIKLTPRKNVGPRAAGNAFPAERDSSGPVSAQQKKSLGLLAILALAGRQGFPRDRIEAYLWPESSAPLAQHSLDQAVYAIRHALGSDFILSSGRELRLNPDLVQVDAWEFEEAIRARQWAAAVERYVKGRRVGTSEPNSCSSEAA